GIYFGLFEMSPSQKLSEETELSVQDGASSHGAAGEGAGEAAGREALIARIVDEFEQFAARALLQGRIAAWLSVDLTKDPDPARVRTAQLNVEQAQLPLQAQRKPLGFEVQQAAEGVKQAEAQQAKVAHPSGYDLQQADEQARAAQAQADGAA